MTEVSLLPARFPYLVPTGIEDILSGTRVYAQDGSIVLEPAMTIQVLVSDMNRSCDLAG